MTNKYNVQLITDVNGKPMPQYYDETEGVMKPITRDNGEITGDVNANVSFPETQNVNGTVSVDNFPQTQQVEVTNQKEVQDVNVTNQATSVDVNNFPELQDVSDGQVRTELEQIKETQSQILERMDVPLSMKSFGNKVEEVQLLDRGIRNQRLTQVFQSNIDPDIKRVIIIFRVYGVTGTFSNGEGYRIDLRKHTRSSIQAYNVAESKFVTNSGNSSGNLFIIDPTFSDKAFDADDKYQLVQDVLWPGYRFMLFIEGSFGEGEGVDCDAVALYMY